MTDERLLLAILYAADYIIETGGGDEIAAWYRDGMDTEYAVRSYFRAGRDKLPERAELLRCTLELV